MAERLDVMRLATQTWWDESGTRRAKVTHPALQKTWWQKLKWEPRQSPAELSQDMVWSNMRLHMEAAPQRLMAAWHAALKVDGFVLFSCLGPDTLQELRSAYARRAWPAPMHTLTDMHDWGDRLIAQGFAEPVMDMERLVLTFTTPERALQELRELGRNLDPKRARGGRSKRWRQELLALLDECRNESGQIALTFELIYGHAIKTKPQLQVAPVAAVSLAAMRQMLKR